MFTETKIESFEIKEGNNGKFGLLTFIENEEKKVCKIWGNTLENIPAQNLRAGNIITASVSETKYGLVIDGVELIKLAPIGLTEVQRDDLFAKLVGLLDTIALTASADEISAIRNLLQENKEKFIIAPAAHGHHHNYVGGLLQHTCEVIMYINDFSDFLPISKDSGLCILAAYIHDFGKIFEYNIDVESGSIAYNESFKASLGLPKDSKIAPHLYWAHNWCVRQGFNKLATIVASHHSLEEWGSMFKPSSPAAEMLFMADYFSSRFGLLHVEDLDNPNKTQFYEYFTNRPLPEGTVIE